MITHLYYYIASKKHNQCKKNILNIIEIVEVILFEIIEDFLSTTSYSRLESNVHKNGFF